MFVTAENIRELMSLRPFEQAEELHPGCETWPIAPLGKPAGQITVWPEAGLAAVSWGHGSFWGRWYDGDRIIRLDEQVDDQSLVVDEAGVLWVSIPAEEFRALMVEKFIRQWEVEGLTRVAEGGDSRALEVIVGCSALPIFKGGEMARALLSALEEVEGPFAKYRPVLQ
ncbi:MAG: hypothetical protein P8Z70_00045 [Desulfuromonadales bacterium]